MTSNTSNDKKRHLINLINESLHEVEKEILKSLDGLDAIDEIQHLRFIKSSLINAKKNLEQDDIETITLFTPSISRIVIDSWPLNNHLGNQICEVEYLYKKFKSAHQNKKCCHTQISSNNT